MPNRATVRNVKAKELSPGLRRRLHLAPEEEINVTVTKGNGKRGRVRRDPWAEIRGMLSPEEADEMLLAIHASRRSKSDTPELDASWSGCSTPTRSSTA
jgi:hypothetical protein